MTSATQQSARSVADAAILLGKAGVPWRTVAELAVTVRLAGLPAVLRLGDSVVDGPHEGRVAVRAVLTGLIGDPVPAVALERVASTMGLLTVVEGSP